MINKESDEVRVNGGERGARRQLIEDLFYDFYRSRHKVYWINFTRGLFFGFGTVLGGTLVVAIVIWLLSLFVTIPYIGDFFHQVIEAIQNVK